MAKGKRLIITSDGYKEEDSKKVYKLLSKLNTDGYDLADLSNELKRRYLEEEDYDEILDDIVKVKDDVCKVVQNLKKELK